MIFRERYSTWIVGSLFFVLFAGAVIPQTLFAQSLTDSRRAELQAQLDQLEKDIASNQATVDALAAQGKSLSNEVKTLNAQIKKAQLQVQATQVAIKSLDTSITVHQKTIGILTSHLDAEKESLAQILRKTNEIDQYSVVEIAFAQGDLSAMLGDLDSYVSLKRSLGKSYEKITGTKLQTEAEKTALEDKRAQQEQIAQIQLQAKKVVQEQQQAKQQLLATTKGQESKYREVVAAKQKSAGQIRAELFSLAGGSGQIPLPTAILLAKQAGGATGVRPAFILGIMKQETNLGQNVGQCLLTNAPNKGDGKGKNSGTPFAGVMKPTRDVDPFMTITSALGLSVVHVGYDCDVSNLHILGCLL
jgi:peptidoglycan hydrolase CwlO-like protein